MINCETAVAAGAAWLDLEKPNWFNEIDIENLNMQHPYHCIIGQLFGLYIIVFPAASDTNGDAEYLGFDYPVEENYGYGQMYTEWVKHIKIRKG